MLNPIRIDHENQRIVMTNTFFKRVCNPLTEEYAILQGVRKDYPTYSVERHTIAKASNKESYSGLTYGYMEDYILTHESAETVDKVLAEFDEMKLISKCHSQAYRYPTIKRWFLNKYPEVRKFGMIAANGNAEPNDALQLAASF